MDEDARSLAQQIQEGFARVPVPSGDSLANDTAGLDKQSILEHFSGKIHQALPKRLTRLFGEDLLYMTPAGVHYYLPAFLIYLLTDDGRAEDGLLNQVLRVLIRANDPALNQGFPKLTDGQCVVISEWLKYLTSHMHEYFVDPEDEDLLARVMRMWG